jgi:hypothetical protein
MAKKQASPGRCGGRRFFPTAVETYGEQVLWNRRPELPRLHEVRASHGSRIEPRPKSTIESPHEWGLKL